jgi:hypothetical protein
MDSDVAVTVIGYYFVASVFGGGLKGAPIFDTNDVVAGSNEALNWSTIIITLAAGK